MSVQDILYLVNKKTKHILLAGEAPAVYGNITGLTGLDYSILRDLAATFGNDYADLGFLTRAEAYEAGVSVVDLDQATIAAWEIKWNGLEDVRSTLIQEQRWRIDRHSDEALLGLPHTEHVTPVLEYCQAIRDLPKNNPNPYRIVWPEIPM